MNDQLFARLVPIIINPGRLSSHCNGDCPCFQLYSLSYTPSMLNPWKSWSAFAFSLGLEVCSSTSNMATYTAVLTHKSRSGWHAVYRKPFTPLTHLCLAFNFCQFLTFVDWPKNTTYINEFIELEHAQRFFESLWFDTASATTGCATCISMAT